MRPIVKGSTDQSVIIRILDDADGTPEQAVEHDSAGISLWYRREGAAVTAIAPAALASASAAHADGGIEHLDDGYYRLDLPDAAVATGVNGVLVGGAVTGMVVIGCYVPLYDVNPYDAVRMGMTALPNAAADAAGGLPISDAGGLNLDAQIGTDIDAIKVVTDLLNSAQAEPTGVPAANDTPITKIGRLHMALRNKVTVTATKKTFFDDGDAAEWEQDLSDDGTTFTQSEANAI